MKYCPNCGNQLNDNAAVCVYCGYSVAPSYNSAPNRQAYSAPADAAYGNVPAVQPYNNAQYYDNGQYGNAQYGNPQYGNAQYGNAQYGNAQYGGAQYGYAQYGYAPVGQLKTDRSLLKYILLSLITFGIYGLVVMSNISTDINTVASRYDGKKTMHFCLVVFLFSWLTMGIVPIIWSHRISDRIGGELRRRGISYSFDASDFWLWDVLGSLIIVGPFIYMNKMLTAMNMLCADYNSRG